MPENLGRHVAVAAGLAGQVVALAGARAAGGAAVAVVGSLRAGPVTLLLAALLLPQINTYLSHGYRINGKR